MQHAFLIRLFFRKWEESEGGGVSSICRQQHQSFENMSAAIPAWKLALLERKKKQEDEEKAKQAQAEEAKIASLPAWKRAIILREKQQAKGVTSSSTPATSSEPPGKVTPKWQVAVERVKGSDSPVLQRWKSAVNDPAPPSPKPAAARGAPPPSLAPTKATTMPSPVLARWKGTVNDPAPPSPKPAAARGAPTSAKATTTPSSPKLPIANNLVTSKWKQPTSTSSESGKKEGAKKPKPTASTSSNLQSTPANLPSAAKSQPEEEDASLAGLPAWKKALILKKRKERSPAVKEVEQVTPDEQADSADKSATTSAAPNPAPIAKQPEVVNRSNGGENEAPSRLVELEGKTLHPPVYKEVDEWANVTEQDNKFKQLPAWKQALIKRRRADIAKRSGLEVPETETPPPNPTPERPLAKKATQAQHTKKPNNTKPHADAAESKKNSKPPSKVYSHERKRKGRLDRPNSHAKSKVHTEEVTRPVRKAPAAPVAKKKEPMFTYNFSKSSTSPHHTGGGASSDSTDSELEDAVITNLDDDSDEGDSGIVLQSYSVDKTSSQPRPTIEQKPASVNKPQPSPTMIQKSASVTSVKKSSITSGKKHMRRVSWSDTQLVSEHFYPKYDYSDYDDLEREEENKNKFMAALAKENSGLSHRLHPSLRRNNDTDSYGGYGGFSPTSTSSRSTTENSLGSFVPKTLSGNTPQMFSDYTDSPPAGSVKEVNELPQELETVEEQTDDFYADLTSNTAALLW